MILWMNILMDDNTDDFIDGFMDDIINGMINDIIDVFMVSMKDEDG